MVRGFFDKVLWYDGRPLDDNINELVESEEDQSEVRGPEYKDRDINTSELHSLILSCSILWVYLTFGIRERFVLMLRIPNEY